jgi:hypothetical protein
LPYKPGYSVAQGAAHWGVWMKRASVPDMVMVVDAIPNVLSQFRVGVGRLRKPAARRVSSICGTVMPQMLRAK